MKVNTSQEETVLKEEQSQPEKGYNHKRRDLRLNLQEVTSSVGFKVYYSRIIIYITIII